MLREPSLHERMSLSKPWPVPHVFSGHAIFILSLVHRSSGLPQMMPMARSHLDGAHLDGAPLTTLSAVTLRLAVGTPELRQGISLGPGRLLLVHRLSAKLLCLLTPIGVPVAPEQAVTAGNI